MPQLISTDEQAIEHEADLPTVIALLRQTLVDLSLVSQASAQHFGPVLPGDEVPPTPPRWRLSNQHAPVPHLSSRHQRSASSRIPTHPLRGEGQGEFRQRSADYFARRFRDCWGPDDIRNLLTEAQEALDAWRRTPEVPGLEPERLSFRWKCMVADDSEGTLSDIAKRHSISRRTVANYRSRYRGLIRRDS